MSVEAPLDDADVEQLQALLDALPDASQAMDVSAIDGFLCGIVLQPRPPAPALWLARITDLEGRPPPPGPAVQEIQAIVQRRHRLLDRAIAERAWFDPWIGTPEQEASPTAPVLPWVAGFALAMELFPALMAVDDPALVEPLALLFLHFDPDDLEDADALVAMIETIEPPADLAEAVQDLVRALMLIADVTRPRPAPRRSARPHGPARRSHGARR